MRCGMTKLMIPGYIWDGVWTADKRQYETNSNGIPATSLVTPEFKVSSMVVVSHPLPEAVDLPGVEAR